MCIGIRDTYKLQITVVHDEPIAASGAFKHPIERRNRHARLPSSLAARYERNLVPSSAVASQDICSLKQRTQPP
jgi:hypothetical protein